MDEDSEIPGAGVIDFASEGMQIHKQPPTANLMGPPPGTSQHVDSMMDGSNLRPDGRPREPPRKKRGRPRDSRPLYSFRVDKQKVDTSAANNKFTATNPARPRGTKMSIKAPPTRMAPAVGVPSPVAPGPTPMTMPALPLFNHTAVTGQPAQLDDRSGWPRSFSNGLPVPQSTPPPPPVPNYGFPPRPQLLAPQPPPPPSQLAPAPITTPAPTQALAPAVINIHQSQVMVPNMPFANKPAMNQNPRPEPAPRPLPFDPAHATPTPARYYVGGGRWVEPPQLMAEPTVTPTPPPAEPRPVVAHSVPTVAQEGAATQDGSINVRLFEEMLYGLDEEGNEVA